MSVSLGVHVERGVVRAVAVDRGAVGGWWEEDRTEGTSLSTPLASLFSTLLSDGLKPRRVVVAVGEAYCRTKELRGLPMLAREELRQLVQSGAARFFVCHAVSPMIAVQPLADRVIADAFDGQLVSELASAVRAARIGSLLVLSTASMAREPSREQRLMANDLPAELAIALDAAVLREPTGLPSLRPVGGRNEPVSRMRASTAVTALVIAVIALLASPVVALRLTQLDAEARLSTIAPEYQRARDIRRELAEIEERQRIVARFLEAPSPSSVLATLTSVLPHDAAMLSFSMDSAGGTAVVVADRVTEVLAGMDTLAVLSSPQLMGPITRERFASGEKERAALRFRWGGAR